MTIIRISVLQLVNCTVEDISVKEGLSHESVAGTLERRIESSIDWTGMADIEVLGLDEIALKKGHRDYVTLVTGRLWDGEIVVLGVLPGHEKARLVEFLRLIPPRILRWGQNVQKSGLHSYDDFLKLLVTCWDEITNYFIQRENSGFIEGFNNKLKVLKRRCYPGTARDLLHLRMRLAAQRQVQVSKSGKCGIFNLKHLFQRIYLDLHGYHLFAATTLYG
ncbi:MAG: transposase [Anaerolineales bacterium]